MSRSRKKVDLGVVGFSLRPSSLHSSNTKLRSLFAPEELKHPCLDCSLLRELHPSILTHPCLIPALHKG